MQAIAQIRARNVAAGNLPPDGLREGMEARSYPFRAKTFDGEALTVEATLATETPARVWDWERWEVVNEVLLMEGLKALPKQVPLLDSHNRARVGDQLGSTLPRKEEGGKLGGVRRFSKVNPRAVEAAGMVGEGHLTDGSIGYVVEKATWIDEGQTKRIRDREFTGPLKVATSWRLIEDSVTPIGADSGAKMRAEIDWSQFEADASRRKHAMEEQAMLEKLRAQFEALGLKRGATDAEVLAFAESLQIKQAPAPAPVPKAETADVESMRREEADRIATIRDIAYLAGDSALGETLIREGTSVEEARKALVEKAKSSGKFGGKAIGTPAAHEEEQVDFSKVDDEVFARSICNPALF